MADEKTFRVIIWGVPRSISTCILKCLSFQPNTQAWCEPYCHAFFVDFLYTRMGFKMPRLMKDFNLTAFEADMAAKVKGTPLENKFHPREMDASLILRDSARMQLDSLPADKSYVIKDMAYAVTDFYDMLPSKEANFKHVFLIRRPDRMFPSWRRLLFKQMTEGMSAGKPLEEETFDMTTDVPFMMPGYTYKCQYDLWKHVRESIDPNPTVIDSDDLATNPALYLPKLCEAVGMPYTDALLEWDGSADIVKTWRCLIPLQEKMHEMTLKSTGFQTPKPAPPRSEMKPDTIKCIDATQQYYDEMAAFKL
ncbi:uncharacterized protein [Diadema antillarum]|uniref:uncharacterized protein n=1 Tax=Diadema antillarum TaxID=105358 RepID=UPI003A8AE5B3